MPAITNDAILMQVLGNDFMRIVDDLSKWLVQQIKMSIWANVYMVGNEPSMYERLGEDGGFLGAWENETAKFIGNYVSSKVGMNPDLMDYNPDMHQHGNPSEDRREYMDELIAMGDGYDFGGNAMMRRDYWSTIAEMIDSGELDSVFESIMTKHGIKFERIS
jgi:hypothetical protein